METKALIRFLLLHATWLALVLLIAARAYVSEDAYITFRVIDNFLAGVGLRWNINERVQVYTHPLWLLLQMALYHLWGNLFQLNLLLSILCSSLAVLIVLHTAKRSLALTFFCLFVPLYLSRAFLDFTSSGLENPLSYLLFASFGYVLVRMEQHPRFWFYISFIAALALLNRLDSLLLYLPALLGLFATRWPQIRVKQALAGALPLIAWCVFALLYYGFLFPNTKYAKLDTGLPLSDYLSSGLHYARFTLVYDPMSMVLMASSLAFLFTRRGAAFAIALGIACTVLYVVYVGGDYMVGRFWSLPVFAAVWLLYVFTPDTINARILAPAALILAFLSTPNPGLRSLRTLCGDSCKVKMDFLIDGRQRFSEGNKLMATLWPPRFNDEGHHNLIEQGKKMREQKQEVTKGFFVGMTGYYAGPDVHIIDILGVGDPLLSRLPVANGRFHIAHFVRKIPQGYKLAALRGNTQLMDPSLARYYDKLKLIISGDIFAPGRFSTILAFNLGHYEHWKRDYLLCTDNRV